MEAEKMEVLWVVGLLIISIATIILAGANFVGILLPDIVVRTAGEFAIITLPVLAFSTVKKSKSRK